MKRDIQRVEVGVGQGNGSERPPNHCLIDVDSPGEQKICEHDRVSETLEDDIVVVLSE
jgi:hypothetical protein